MANKNRIAYAICSAHGIDTTGMSPKEAWEKAKEVADKNELADLTQDSPKETKKEEPKEEKVDYNALRMGKKQDDSDKQDEGEETRNFNNFHKEQDKPKSNHKSETRKDKYGNPLVSDEAFNIGVRAAKDYIEESTKYGYNHNKLKTSNIYVDTLQKIISEAIIDAGLDPDFDVTYQDLNEIIGAATGDEINLQNATNPFNAWTGKKYSGYQPKKEVKSTDYNALRMGKKQDEGEQKVDYNAKRLGKNDKVADEFSYEGKENDIKKLKQAGFNVDSGYSSGNTFEIFDKDTGNYNKINIGKNGKYFSAVISGTVYTYKDLETAIDRATYKSGKAPSQGAIGWENGGYDSETYDNYMKEVWFGKQEKPTTSNEESIDYENIEYPKGTSKKYTKYVNEQFENAKPILEKAGIKSEDFGGKPSKEGGYEDNTKEIMNKYVFEPFRKKYPNGNNDVWEKAYQPLYDAIEAVADKNYNDWYIRNNKK